jgi:hypothetical protein
MAVLLTSCFVVVGRSGLDPRDLPLGLQEFGNLLRVLEESNKENFGLCCLLSFFPSLLCCLPIGLSSGSLFCVSEFILWTCTFAREPGMA